MGAKKNLFKALTSPAWTFFKLYVLKGGFKEGFAGYVIARLYAQYTFWTVSYTHLMKVERIWEILSQEMENASKVED